VQLHAIECPGISSLLSSTTKTSQKYYRHLFLGEGAGGWEVDESRTVRLFMRMLVLRAIEMGKLELGSGRGDVGVGGKRRKIEEEEGVVDNMEEGQKAVGGEGEEEGKEEEESDESEDGVDVPSYDHAMEALCKLCVCACACACAYAYACACACACTYAYACAFVCVRV